MLRRHYLTFLLLFALSGFSGLIYESIWTHYLKLFLGHAAYAQTLVLAIFMGGMALGSFVCSRYSARWKNLFAWYAIAEGIIGITAIFFHPVFDSAIRFSFERVIPSLGSHTAITGYKWTVSSLLILPQTVLLGMTFPLMSSAILRQFPENPGRSVSMLYFTNSIGAVFGVLMSGFWLIRLVGLPGTIRFAGLLNLLIAALVLYFIKGQPIRIQPAAPVNRSSGTQGGRNGYLLLLLVSLITGAASFIYEVTWIRMLSLVLGSSTHAFELMLSAFILGLALGGLWMQRRIDRIAVPVRSLMTVQVTMGLLALFTLPLYGQTFDAMKWLLKQIGKTEAGYIVFSLSSHALASAIMLPATFCAGMTLPLITVALLKGGHGEKSIGAVYGANTVGAITGVFLAVHWGMPSLGLKVLLVFGACLDIILGLVLLWSPALRGDKKWLPPALTAGCIAAVIVVISSVTVDPYKMASGLYRDVGELTRDNSNLLYHEDGKTATVSIVQQDNGVMQIRTNGKADAAIYVKAGLVSHIDEATMVLAAALPLSMHPDAKTAANIGLGSGLTTSMLLSDPNLERVDTIEIEQKMVDAARNFGSFSAVAYSDPRSSIHIEDAKTFFSAQQMRYDIIISEPSNPWVSGVAGLFSREFYHLINRHLNRDGLFVQWVQLYEIDISLVASVLKAVSSEFSDFAVFAPSHSDLLIVAGNGKLRDPQSRLFSSAAASQMLKRVSIRDVQDIMIRKIGDRQFLHPLIESFRIRPNSDYYPVLDQNAERVRFLKSTAQEFIALAHEPLPVQEMLMDSRRTESTTRVTPTPFFPKTEKAAIASRMHDILLGRGTTDLGSTAARTAEEQAYGLKHLFFECGAFPAGQRNAAIFNGSLAITPYLSPEELEAIWARLEAGPCKTSFTRTERSWVSLFRALGSRDAGAVSRIALQMLSDNVAGSDAEQKYLIASAMTGLIAQGKKHESGLVWTQHQDRITGSSAGILFRLLSASSTVGTP